MNSKRLGCLSPSGQLSAVITLLIVSGFVLVSGGRIFSPGPLHAQESGLELGGVKSHAQLDTRCGACHAPYWGSEIMSDRCLACHLAIADQISTSTGLHGGLAENQPRFDCLQCHTEHLGSDANLTRLDPDGFPHELTGYWLSGHGSFASGEGFECQDCHLESLSSFDPQRCFECHLDLDSPFLAAHTEVFGATCLACHDGIDTFGPSFSHAETGFPLTGSHETLDCGGCHLGDIDLIRLRDTPLDCYSCHEQDDNHRGQFGRDCAACHTPESWEGAEFDHSLSGFPLEGEHAGVACESCHTTGVFAGTSQLCSDCHLEDDAHDGQFGTDCGVCHTAQGWEFVSFDHDLAEFQLTGAHLNVPCTSCHLEGVFSGTPIQCGACHAEPLFHQGLFPSDCGVCHTTTAWRPAFFDQLHTFPINHGEPDNTCQTCHPSVLSSYTCYNCHDRAEMEEEHFKEDIFNFQNCMDCHPTGLKENDDD